jgi:hypothetical protein
MESENAVTHRYGYGLPVTRGGVAWALHDWFTALAAAKASVKGDIYESAAGLVVEHLASQRTCDQLFGAYFNPDLELTRLITELCTEGAILLQPHLLMGAAFALRLRQLIAETVR